MSWEMENRGSGKDWGGTERTTLLVLMMLWLEVYEAKSAHRISEDIVDGSSLQDLRASS